MTFDPDQTPSVAIEGENRGSAKGKKGKESANTKRIGSITSGVVFKEDNKLIVQARPDKHLNGSRIKPDKAKLRKGIRYFRYFTAPVVWKNFDLEQLSAKDAGDLVPLDQDNIVESTPENLDDGRDEDDVNDVFGVLSDDVDGDESDHEESDRGYANDVFEHAVARARKLAAQAVSQLQGEPKRNQVDEQYQTGLAAGVDSIKLKNDLIGQIDRFELDALCRILEVEVVPTHVMPSQDEVLSKLVGAVEKMGLISEDDPVPNAWRIQERLASDPEKLVALLTDVWNRDHDPKFLRALLGFKPELPLDVYCRQEALMCEKEFTSAKDEAMAWYAKVQLCILQGVFDTPPDAEDRPSGASEGETEEELSTEEDGDEADGQGGPENIIGLVSALNGLGVCDALINVKSAASGMQKSSLGSALERTDNDAAAWQKQEALIADMSIVAGRIGVELKSLRAVGGRISSVGRYIKSHAA